MGPNLTIALFSHFMRARANLTTCKQHCKRNFVRRPLTVDLLVEFATQADSP